ncbi:MAG: NfeD family protein [Acetobacteraceae bacterium]
MGIGDAIGLTPGIVWIFAGLVMLGLEVVLPGAFLMWIGIAAVGTGIGILLTDIGFAAAVVTFAVLAALSVWVGLHLRRPPRRLNTQSAGLAGREAISIGFTGRTGRVRVGDSDWSARVPPDVPIPEPGTRLRVEGVDGTVLIVRPDPV